MAQGTRKMMKSRKAQPFGIVIRQAHGPEQCRGTQSREPVERAME